MNRPHFGIRVLFQPTMHRLLLLSFAPEERGSNFQHFFFVLIIMRTSAIACTSAHLLSACVSLEIVTVAWKPVSLLQRNALAETKSIFFFTFYGSEDGRLNHVRTNHSIVDLHVNRINDMNGQCCAIRSFSKAVFVRHSLGMCKVAFRSGKKQVKQFYFCFSK